MMENAHPSTIMSHWLCAMWSPWIGAAIRASRTNMPSEAAAIAFQTIELRPAEAKNLICSQSVGSASLSGNLHSHSAPLPGRFLAAKGLPPGGLGEVPGDRLTLFGPMQTACDRTCAVDEGTSPPRMIQGMHLNSGRTRAVERHFWDDQNIAGRMQSRVADILCNRVNSTESIRSVQSSGKPTASCALVPTHR